MPEIIDLEVARENMLARVKGRTVKEVDVPEPKVLRNATAEEIQDAVVGRELDDISRVSKILEFKFGDVSLAFHLMLHGDFCWKGDKKSDRNVAVSMEFDSGDTILVKDWSRWMKVELHDPSSDKISELLEGEYGIDPLSHEFTVEKLAEICLQKSRSGVKGVLMDQKLVSGIGNAYADEILWDAKIHPKTTCGSILKSNSIEVLWKSIKGVLQNGLDTVRALSEGRSISEQERDFMNVYRKSGQKCPRCGYMIACRKVNSRDTFICEKCQEKQ